MLCNKARQAIVFMFAHLKGFLKDAVKVDYEGINSEFIVVMNDDDDDVELLTCLCSERGASKAQGSSGSHLYR